MEAISRAAAKQTGEIYYFTGQPCAYGHISRRFVRNYTCVECEYARGRGELLLCPLPQCVICGDDVRVPGHATCSTECGNKQAKAKELAKRELKCLKRCHGCGSVHYRFRKWYCCDECRQHKNLTRSLKKPYQPRPPKPHQPRPPKPPVSRECVFCETAFTTTTITDNRKFCSQECSRRFHYQRQLGTGYIRDLGRERRSKIAASLAVARDLGIVPRPRDTRRRPNRTASDEQWLADFAKMQKRKTEVGICRTCGCLLPPRGDRRGRNQKYCSRVCLQKFATYKIRYDAGPKCCPHCGKAWWPTNVNRYYCSDGCSALVAIALAAKWNKKLWPRYKEQRRRRERKNYAIMLAFKRMGLLEKKEIRRDVH